MAFDELYPGRVSLHDFVDEYLAIRINSLAYKMLALGEIEAACQVGVAAPSVEIGFRLAVPCSVRAFRLRFEAISHSIQGHAAHNLTDKAGVADQIAGTANKLRAYARCQVERGIARSTAGNLSPAR